MTASTGGQVEYNGVLGLITQVPRVAKIWYTAGIGCLDDGGKLVGQTLKGNNMLAHAFGVLAPRPRGAGPPPPRPRFWLLKLPRPPCDPGRPCSKPPRPRWLSAPRGPL